MGDYSGQNVKTLFDFRSRPLEHAFGTPDCCGSSTTETAASAKPRPIAVPKARSLFVGVLAHAVNDVNIA